MNHSCIGLSEWRTSDLKRDRDVDYRCVLRPHVCHRILGK